MGAIGSTGWSVRDSFCMSSIREMLFRLPPVGSIMVKGMLGRIIGGAHLFHRQGWRPVY